MKSFADLGVHPRLVDALTRAGIEAPFAIQAATIEDALAGRDVCGRADTGSGKTLAFSVPLVQRCSPRNGRDPRALVLVPTRELALQVAEVLGPLARAMGRRAVAVYGGASISRQIHQVARGVDIVVATPGRLTDLVDRGALSVASIDLLVIDEADRMADMGFLPQVRSIVRHFADRRPQVLLFSATLDGDVDGLVREYLHDPVRHEVPGDDAAAERMTHRFVGVQRTDRVKLAAQFVRAAGRTIVFVRTKRGADRLAVQLGREGVPAVAIHGDRTQSARERALADFASGRLDVLVATDVAARGIHVDDVDAVVHFDPPADHKTYLHRSGRTARAGRTGTVATFVLHDQRGEVKGLQRELGIREPIVDVRLGDPRIATLVGREVATAGR